MAETREGGCLCGTARYRVVGEPIEVMVCHCTLCQLRAGSAFGISVYFPEKDVEVTRGILKTYEYRSDESNRWLKMEFCPICGTTPTWTVEKFPGERGIAGGTFDDPNWVKPRVHLWTRSAHHWIVPPLGVKLTETD